MKVQAGQKVWVIVKNYHGKERDPVEATVSKVGRKYFQLHPDETTKYSLETGVEAIESNYCNRVYLTLQEILDEKEHVALSNSLKQVFGGYGRLPYPLDVLRKVAELLEIKPPTLAP